MRVSWLPFDTGPSNQVPGSVDDDAFHRQGTDVQPQQKLAVRSHVLRLVESHHDPVRIGADGLLKATCDVREGNLFADEGGSIDLSL